MDTRNVKRNFPGKIQKRNRSRPGLAPRKLLCHRRLNNSPQPQLGVRISRGRCFQLGDDSPPDNELPLLVKKESLVNQVPMNPNELPNDDNQIEILESEEEEEDPNSKKLQSYPSTSDVQIQIEAETKNIEIQTELPNHYGFCYHRCDFIMTGLLCSAVCRFLPPHMQ